MELTQRYLAIDGVPGIGKTALATALAGRLRARVVSGDAETNPFLAEFQRDAKRAAFHTQLFFLLSRFKQQQTLYQPDLFQQMVIADYHFNRDRIYALLALSDAELSIYEMIFGLLVDQVPKPDLVIYLQAPGAAVRQRWRTWGNRAHGAFTEQHLDLLVEAYNHYYFHYAETPLLVVNTGELDFLRQPEELDALLEQLAAATAGTRYYVPAGGGTRADGTQTVLS